MRHAGAHHEIGHAARNVARRHDGALAGLISWSATWSLTKYVIMYRPGYPP